MRGRITLTAAATIAALAAAMPQAQTSAPPGGSIFLTPFELHAGTRTIPAEEGLLFVPENRAKRGSRNIAVHFVRVRGSKPGHAPIFFLPGGPGSFVTRANIEQARNIRELDFLSASGRDVLFVNQRGNPAAPLTPNLTWPASSLPLDRAESDEGECAARIWSNFRVTATSCWGIAETASG